MHSPNSVSIQEHRFFHADGWNKLDPNQDIQPMGGPSGLSVFGTYYATQWLRAHGPLTPALVREMDLDLIRQQAFGHRSSRFRSMFCAKSIDDALHHVRRNTSNGPHQVVRVFEVYAKEFHEHDSMWLDLAGPAVNRSLMQERYVHYWKGDMSRDLINGYVRPPLVEVLTPLPIRIGDLVHEVPLAQL